MITENLKPELQALRESLNTNSQSEETTSTGVINNGS